MQMMVLPSAGGCISEALRVPLGTRYFRWNLEREVERGRGGSVQGSIQVGKPSLLSAGSNWFTGCGQNCAK